MILERYQLATLVAMLVSCGERLDIDGNPVWNTVATTAGQLERLHDGVPVDISRIAESLRQARSAVATVDKKNAVVLDLALNVVDALRLGLLELRPMAMSIGMAFHNAQPVRRWCHA